MKYVIEQLSTLTAGMNEVELLLLILVLGIAFGIGFAEAAYRILLALVYRPHNKIRITINER